MSRLIATFLFLIGIGISIYITFNAHAQPRLAHSVGDQADGIDHEAVSGQFEEFFLACLVPKLVEKLVIVFLSQSGLDHSVQILLRLYPLHFLTK